MFYIVALGNPGKEYGDTRHNVGFLLLEKLTKKWNLPLLDKSKQFSGRLTTGLLETEPISCLFPETFMNHSGVAVKKLVPSDQVSKLIVIYDDIALPIGKIKISVGKNDGGHNGVKSIIKELGSKDFIRIRVGIGPVSFWTGKPKILTGKQLTNFVLGRFSSRELSKINDLEDQVDEVVKIIIKKGVSQAMNQFN